MRNDKLKLILCLVLSLTMLLSVACVTAMASDSPYYDEPESPENPDVPEDHTHSFSVWFPIPGSSGKHVRHCECGKAEHENCSYDDGAVTTRPTYEADGVRTFTCQVCSGTKTEKINKLNPGEPDPYAEEGESKAWIIPLVVAIVAALGTVACGLIIIKKKSDEKKDAPKNDSKDNPTDEEKPEKEEK